MKIAIVIIIGLLFITIVICNTIVVIKMMKIHAIRKQAKSAAQWFSKHFRKDGKAD